MLFSQFTFKQVIRLTVFVTDTTAPALQQGKGLLIITIIDINEQPPVSVFSFFTFLLCLQKSQYQFIKYENLHKNVTLDLR